MSGRVNGAVSKRLRPIMAETDGEVVHCPSAGNKHWRFDSRSEIFPFGGSRDSMFMNIDCMYVLGK